MVKFLLLAAALALASGSAARAEDKEARERKVRVALALADASPKTVAVAAKAPAVALDWFGDAPAAKVAHAVPCICGNDCKCAAGTCPGGCPVSAKPAAAVNYEVRKQCQEWVDARGYLHRQCVDVLVAVPAIGK